MPDPPDLIDARALVAAVRGARARYAKLYADGNVEAEALIAADPSLNPQWVRADAVDEGSAGAAWDEVDAAEEALGRFVMEATGLAALDTDNDLGGVNPTPMARIGDEFWGVVWVGTDRRCGFQVFHTPASVPAF